MSRQRDAAREWVERLRSAAGRLSRPHAFMEVCGTHTMNACRSGLHSVMPAGVRLLSGPGCPVCVTSQGDVDRIVEVAGLDRVTVCTYGDMVRVTGSRGSLETARAGGADVRVVYSALDAVKLAEREPRRQVVFVGVGFETTAPATAAAVVAAGRDGLENFSVLVSHKRLVPAMRALLSSGRVRVDGFLCPGHVAIVVGAEAFRPIVEDFGRRCVISGFEDVQIAAGVARLTEMAAEGVTALENQYAQAVSPAGNRVAMGLIDRVFEDGDAVWRGLGEIPGSGMRLRAEFRGYDARQRFGLSDGEVPEPRGCRCGEVITGNCDPSECPLFGRICTPAEPVGPCMVSSEGVCAAWSKYRRERGAEPIREPGEWNGLGREHPRTLVRSEGGGR